MVGTKEGTLDVIDVGASSRLDSLQAHSGAVWSLAALPDNRYVLTYAAYGCARQAAAAPAYVQRTDTQMRCRL